MSNLKVLFNQYQQKYPLYSKEAIIDLMFNDGIINLDLAKKLLDGTSLFLIEDLSGPQNQNCEINLHRFLEVILEMKIGVRRIQMIDFMRLC